MTIPTTWTTKDGRVLLIKEMTTEHLSNTVAMLRRKSFVTEDEYLNFAGAVASFTGEMSSYYAEAEIFTMKVSPALGALEAELARRRASHSPLTTCEESSSPTR